MLAATESRCFNPRPRVGCDATYAGDPFLVLMFQSTLPVWGATRAHRRGRGRTPGFNPRSPCGERRFGRRCVLQEFGVSIHAPRVGSDTTAQVNFYGGQMFQSTLPVWGATRPRRSISTAARCFNPRSPCGSDISVSFGPPPAFSFNPRSPCGERRVPSATPLDISAFQSTLPVWGATAFPRPVDLARVV